MCILNLRCLGLCTRTLRVMNDGSRQYLIQPHVLKYHGKYQTIDLEQNVHSVWSLYILLLRRVR